MSQLRSLQSAFAGLAALVLLAMPLRAQQPAPPDSEVPNASVSGVVTAAATGEPLMGVQVIVKGTRRWAITNSDGLFTIEKLTPGAHALEVRHPQRAPMNFTVNLEANKMIELAVRLDTRTVALPEVVVEGKVNEPAAKMHDFYWRANAGHGGYFITRKDIEEKQPRILSDMLRSVPGLRVSCDFGSCQVNSFMESRRIMGGCPIQYFLDGLPFLGDIDEMTPDQVEGIEIFRGSSSIPPQYNTGTSMCGVIGIWSRVPG